MLHVGHDKISQDIRKEIFLLLIGGTSDIPHYNIRLFVMCSNFNKMGLPWCSRHSLLRPSAQSCNDDHYKCYNIFNKYVRIPYFFSTNPQRTATQDETVKKQLLQSAPTWWNFQSWSKIHTIFTTFILWYVLKLFLKQRYLKCCNTDTRIWTFKNICLPVLSFP